MSFDGPVSVPVLAKKAKKPDWTGLPSTTGYWAVSLSGHSFWIRQFRLRRHLPGLLRYLRKTLLFLQQFRLLPRVFRHLCPSPPLQFLLLAQQLLCLLANLMVLKRSKSDYLTLPYPPNPLLYPTTFLTSLLCLKNIMNSLMFSTRRRPTHSLHIDLTI